MVGAVEISQRPDGLLYLGQPLVRCVEESLAQVEHQIWLLRNVGWWVLNRNLRIEVESSGDDTPIYAFVSTTDNATQRFTVITPK